MPLRIRARIRGKEEVIMNRRQKWLRIPVALLLVMMMIVPCAAQTDACAFEDVESGQWFAPAVQYVFQHKLMNGISESEFAPDRAVSRGMAVTVLFRMEQPAAAKRAVSFADVEEGRFYSEAVGWAASEAIVEGYGNGEFGPLDDVSREQLAKIIYKYAECLHYDLGKPADSLDQYTDRADVSGWAESALKWAVGAEIIKGDNDRLMPKDPLSRKQLAQILQRVDEKIAAGKDPSGGQGQTGENPGDETGRNGTFADDMAARMPADKNWSLSPYSLEMCMAMFANGTNGPTREEFLDVLRIRDLDAYNASSKELLEKYASFREVMDLETANSIWLNQTEFGGKGSFLESFSSVLQLFYGAEAREVTSANSIESINAWTKEKTHGLIERIAEEDNRDFATAVANALYFKARWALPFDEHSTEDKPFYNLDGSESQVPFMHQRDYFGYYSENGVRAVKMDYSNTLTDPKTGKTETVCPDADFSMYILMSDNETVDVQKILDSAEFASTKVDLNIPRFRIEYGGPLDEHLQDLGILTAYDPNNADLSGMVDLSLLNGRNLYLDSVVQKAFVSVDEAGTEAAAVTVMFVKRNTTSVDTKPVVYFTADRPFWFAIRDNTSGRLLFTGKYVKAGK